MHPRPNDSSDILVTGIVYSKVSNAEVKQTRLRVPAQTIYGARTACEKAQPGSRYDTLIRFG